MFPTRMMTGKYQLVELWRNDGRERATIFGEAQVNIGIAILTTPSLLESTA
jgi:hypothetical protein